MLRRPIIPAECQHNAHMYYVLLSPEIDRQMVLENLTAHNISAVFHYVPLHSSPGGLRYGRTHGSMEVTAQLSECLLRLPLWIGISEEQQDKIVDTLTLATN